MGECKLLSMHSDRIWAGWAATGAWAQETPRPYETNFYRAHTVPTYRSASLSGRLCMVIYNGVTGLQIDILAYITFFAARDRPSSIKWGFSAQSRRQLSKLTIRRLTISPSFPRYSCRHNSIGHDGLRIYFLHQFILLRGFLWFFFGVWPYLAG